MASSETTLGRRKRRTRIILEQFLDCDFDFHGEKSSHSTHALHSFPAKFPPQLPALFIEKLTDQGDIVLDPMAGSGTTLVEAANMRRYAIGVDIDPLAVEICRAKTSYPGEPYYLAKTIDKVVSFASDLVESGRIECILNALFDDKSQEFINYWFLPNTQRELAALVKSIDHGLAQSDSKYREDTRRFLLLCLSSIIIRKSGGVSLARDLAHSRPHRDLSKKIPNAISAFRDRARKSLAYFSGLKGHARHIEVFLGDARDLSRKVDDDSIDLIVTSPPYSNAIDYMRTNKFSLVWMGYSIAELSALRSRYLGSEKLGRPEEHSLPSSVRKIAHQVGRADKQKEGMIIKYHAEMKAALREMHRVLKPDSAAIIVAGSSIIKGIDTQTHKCMAEVAAMDDIGFDLVGITMRNLDRNRRMMPWQSSANGQSLIEKRMGQEHIIFLRKP